MVRGTPEKTKHATIFEHVHRAILDGGFKLGQRIPSETQLSRQFHTTRVTVAKALRNLEHAGFLERRAGSGTYVRMPASARTRLLALLVPDLGQGEIFEPICSAIAAGARTRQFTILWGHSDSPPDDPAAKCRQAIELCQQYVAQKVDGVFFSPIEHVPGMEPTNQRITEMLDRAGIAVVLLDRDVVKHPRRSRYDLVGIDNRRAGYLLTDHLLELGCRRIDFVFRAHSAVTIDARIAGYREAMQAHGLPFQDKWIHAGEAGDLEFVRQLVGRRPPDAFLCGNDFTAAQLMQSLIQLGLRVPEDVRVVGVDDVKYARLLAVPLTTIRQPCAALGGAAVDAMIRRIEEPAMPARDVLVDFQLVVRQSSDPTAKEVKA